MKTLFYTPPADQTTTKGRPRMTPILLATEAGGLALLACYFLLRAGATFAVQGVEMSRGERFGPLAVALALLLFAALNVAAAVALFCR